MVDRRDTPAVPEVPESRCIRDDSDEWDERIRALHKRKDGIFCDLYVRILERDLQGVDESSPAFKENASMPRKLLKHGAHWLQQDSAGQAILCTLFEESASDPALAAELTVLFGKDVTRGVTWEDAVACIDSDTMSDGLLMRLLAHHRRITRGRIADVRRELLTLQESLLADIDRLRQEGVITLSDAVIQRRLSQTHISIHDPFVSTSEGDFDADSRTILVRLDGSPEERKHRYYHEMVHALLSGFIIEVTPDRRIRHRKNGLSFTQDDSHTSMGTHRYTWLNEAVTEDMTIRLLGLDPKDGRYYPLERLQLYTYIQQGLDPALLHAAYVEGADTLDAESLPHWQKLRKRMDEISGTTNVLDTMELFSEDESIRQQIATVLQEKK